MSDTTHSPLLSQQITRDAKDAELNSVLLPHTAETLHDWAQQASSLETQLAHLKKMHENLTNRVVQAINILAERAQTNYEGQAAASVGLRAYNVLVTKDPSDG